MNKETGKTSSTEVAIRTRDVPVTYSMKRALVRPVVLGLRDALIETGEVFFRDFGRFYVDRRNVSKGVGSQQRKNVVAIRFRPSKSFMKGVTDRWSTLLSLQEPASFVAGEASEESSAGAEGAPAASSST